MIVATTTAALLIGCGGGSGETSGESGEGALPTPIQEVVISTDGLASPETAGILMANQRGYFDKFRISIWFRPPVTPTRPIQYLVGSGEIDLAISHAPQVVMARDRSAPIVAIGNLVEHPTAAMIWLGRSDIENIADLKGKTIAFPGLSFQKALLESFLAQGGLSLRDVKLTVAGYELVPALVKGEADAIFGGSWNLEGVQLQARGLNPEITRVEGSGVPSYDELVLIARPDYLSEHPRLVRNFLAATARGTEAVLEDSEAAARLVAKSDSDRKLKTTEAEVEATLPLLSETGEMSPRRWNKLVAWMHDRGAIEGTPPAAELITNQYLASQPGG